MRNADILPLHDYIVPEEESERIRIWKVWLAILVVFLHSYGEDNLLFRDGGASFGIPLWLDWTEYALTQVVTRCAVPGYFFIASVFLYRKSFTWRGNMRKKLKTLLVPYLIINTVWIGIYFTAQHISFLSSFFSRPDQFVANWTWREWVNAYVGLKMNPFIGPLWFVRELLIFNVLALVLKRLIDAAPKVILTVLAALMLLCIEPEILHRLRDGLVFFCLGYYFVKYDIHFSDVDRIPAGLLCGAYFVSLSVDVAMRDMTYQYLPRILSMGLGMLFFARFVTKIQRNTWRKKLLWFSGYGYCIYLFHENTLSLSRKVAARLLPQNTLFQVLEAVGVPLAVIAVCVAVGVILKRYLPKLYGVLTGGRKI